MPGARASFATERTAAASALALVACSRTSSAPPTGTRGARPSPVCSSSATWKFEPPKPNELTEARRG